MTHLQELFIKNLRFFRKKQGMSQLAFSEMIEISPNYLNAVENGKNFPSPELLQNIADSLGILPYQLFLEYPVAESSGGSYAGSSGEMESHIQELAELRRRLIGEIDAFMEKYRDL
jgi:transcriptional regulator with XRE-family HTH domain